MRSSLIFYPNLSKKSAKTGKIPVYLRVISNGKAECRLNIELSDQDLAKWNPIQMRLQERKSYVNDALNAIEVEFKKFQSQNATNKRTYSAAEIRDNLLNKNGHREITIFKFCQDYFDKTIGPKRDMSVGTKKNYQKALRHMAIFHSFKGFDNLKLSEMNISYVHMFWDYLLSDVPSLNKKGMTEVSASGIFKKFKTIFDRAYSEELLSKNHFKAIKSRNRSPQREKLNMNEVALWGTTDLTHFPSFHIYRDLFLFSLLTGLAYSDLMTLKQSHLHELSNQEVLLKKNRHKTDEPVEAILVSQAKLIVEKYISPRNMLGSDFVFPRRSLKTVNYYYQIIADKIGIKIKVTSHIARHTYRQILNEAGITEPGIIKRMMGQSYRSNIDSVYFAVNENNLLSAKETLQAYLDQKLPK